MRFAIIDDHPFVMDALSFIISSLKEQPAVSGFGSMARFEEAAARGETFDIVLLDLGIPGFTGLESLRRFRELDSFTPVVVISASDDRATVLEALDLGAMGFIPKSSGRDVLMGALELILAGGIYIPPQALGKQEGSAAKPSSEPPAPARGGRRANDNPSLGTALSTLTKRQCDVLELLVKGLSNKLICRELDLSPNTIKSHMSAIFRALHATNRTQAVLAAQSAGYRVGYKRDPSRSE